MIYTGLLLFVLLYVLTFSKENITVLADSTANDTCFYDVKVPADLDVPGTPFYEASVIRNGSCKIHILRLPKWGTSTDYSLLPGATTEKMPEGNFKTHCNAGIGEACMIDITKLPVGKYSMSLMACGNGGGFGLQIK